MRKIAVINEEKKINAGVFAMVKAITVFCFVVTEMC